MAGSRLLSSRSWQTLCRRSWTVCSMCHGSACSIASWSRSWMCQCHRSGRKSWSLLLVRSSATLVQASGDSTGGRAQIEQIVDVPVPQIWERSVEVIKVILQEQCQRMHFFLLTMCGEGAVGPTANSHTSGLILSASDGMFVVYHIREHTTTMTALCLCVVRKMSSASPARACMSSSIASLSFVPCTFFRQFHRLHSEWGQMINATAINAVPVLEDVYFGKTEEWSLRLNVPQHVRTHQVLTL